MAEMDDDELLDALGVDLAPLKASSRTPREERIIAGFEDILRFHRKRSINGVPCAIGAGVIGTAKVRWRTAAQRLGNSMCQGSNAS